jgi:tetratricopeptide (TPR) repeat protein
VVSTEQIKAVYNQIMKLFKATLLNMLLLLLLSLQTQAESQSSNTSQVLNVTQSDAKTAFDKKDYRKVVDLLGPHSGEINLSSLQYLADSHHALKEYADEVRVLRLVAGKKDKSPVVHFKLGEALRLSGNAEEAVANFRIVIDLTPSFLPAYRSLVKIFLERNNHYESRILLTDMIKKFGNKPEFLTPLCKLYSKDGFHSEGIKICQNAIQADTKDPENHLNLAQIYKDKNQEPMYQSIIVKAAKRFKKSESLQYAAGAFFQEKKNYVEASRYLDFAIKADDNSVRSHLARADTLFELGQLDKSLDSYYKTCILDRRVPPSFEISEAKLRAEGKSTLAAKYRSQINKCLDIVAKSNQ